MRTIAVSGLALLLAACTSYSSRPGLVHDACAPLVVVPGAGTTDAERAAIAAGIALWQQEGVQPFTLDDAPGAARLTLSFEDAAPIFHGFYDPETGEISINRGLVEPHALAVTIAHELGHSIGLVHVSDRASVMEKANLQIEPNREDVASVQAIWGDCARR